MVACLHQYVFLSYDGSIYWKDSKQLTNGSWVCCRYIECILILIIVTELDVIPSDAIILFCKDDGPIALTKEPRSHQKFKHIEQGYTRLPQVEIHRGTESWLHIEYGRLKSLSQPKIKAYLDLKRLKYMVDWL